MHPHAAEQGLASTPRPDVHTLYDISVFAAKSFGDRKCMGTREFLGNKTPKIKHFGDTIHWITFTEMFEIAQKFGAALRKAGCQPAPPTTNLTKVTTSCRMAIFENTCAPWMLAAMGAFTQGIAVTTVYATLGMDAVVEAIVDNMIPVVVCNKRDVAKLVGQIKKMPTLRCIVYTNDLVAPTDVIDMPAPPRGVTVISFDDFVASGDTKAFPITPPAPDSCAVVMYTSGSTGKPKGVMITHRQILGMITSVEKALNVTLGEEAYLAYLPLAHIMELTAEFTLIGAGCTLCYADPKSLSTTGAYPVGALEAFSPTMMVAVPKIWDVIKKGVEAKVAQTSPVAQFLVETAFEWRGFALKHGFDTPLFKRLVFRKLKQAVGGRLTYGLSGGGPTNSEVQDFIRTAFGITLVQGYVSWIIGLLVVQLALNEERLRKLTLLFYFRFIGID
jgi:long-chain acyl-CoA synthetase